MQIRRKLEKVRNGVKRNFRYGLLSHQHWTQQKQKHDYKAFHGSLLTSGSRIPKMGLFVWAPTITQFFWYRDRVRQTVDRALERTDLTNAREPFFENGQIFRVAIEHRFMHAETLAYMFHWLDYELKRDPAGLGAGTANGRNGGTPVTRRS